ncbi:hypothetical protein VTK56DRAFT_246 [Thermocarpiscus australiensis]
MLSTVAVGGAVVRRLAEDPPNWKLPPSSAFFFIGDFVLFFPVLLIIGYSLGHVYPTLAAVEDPLPAYEAVPIDDDPTPKDDTDPVRAAQPGKPITSSLRAINRLLRSYGSGWTANFRGIGYATVLGLLTAATTSLFSLPPFVPTRLGHLLALLALAPLATAWTHVVVTPPSAKSFRQRIPPLRKTYVATWLPTVLLWAASHAAVVAPAWLAHLIGLSSLSTTSSSRRPGGSPSFGADGSAVAKALCVAGVALALQVLLVVPASVALARVQASLLPADEDALVPFDRSFGGRVEPAVVSGKGFASVRAALATVSRASWLRIGLLRVKVFGVALVAYTLMAAVVVAQVLLLRKMCDGGEDGGDGASGYKCY